MKGVLTEGGTDVSYAIFFMAAGVLVVVVGVIVGLVAVYKVFI